MNRARMLITMALLAVVAAEVRAEDKAKLPPWQRMLSEADLKETEKLVEQIAQLQVAGKWKEAAEIARTLAEFRAAKQGADHWQALSARIEAETLTKVAGLSKDVQARYGQLVEMRKKASALEGQGRYRDSQPLLNECLQICRELLGEEHPDTSTRYHQLSVNLHNQGKHKEAEEGYRKSLAIYRKFLGEEHRSVAISLTNLANCLNAQEKYAEAEPLYRQALTLRRKLLGEGHLDTATSMINLAMNLKDQMKAAEAESLARQGLAIDRKLLGEEHPVTLSSINALALTLTEQDKYAEAELLHRHILALRRKLLGEEHLDTATSINNLAFNLCRQDKYTDAETLHRQELALCRKLLGEEHRSVAISLNNLANCLNAQEKYAEAEPLYRQALTLRRKLLGEGHLDTATSLDNLAYNLIAQGKYTEAETLLVQSAEVFEDIRIQTSRLGLERSAAVRHYTPFPELPALLARNDKVFDAWQHLEQGMGRGTLDDMALRLKWSPAEQQESARLRETLDRIDNQLDRLSPSDTEPVQTRRHQLLDDSLTVQKELTAL